MHCLREHFIKMCADNMTKFWGDFLHKLYAGNIVLLCTSIRLIVGERSSTVAIFAN
jgi:hypothetical protein